MAIKTGLYQDTKTIKLDLCLLLDSQPVNKLTQLYIYNSLVLVTVDCFNFPTVEFCDVECCKSGQE